MPTKILDRRRNVSRMLARPGVTLVSSVCPRVDVIVSETESKQRTDPSRPHQQPSVRHYRGSGLLNPDIEPHGITEVNPRVFDAAPRGKPVQITLAIFKGAPIPGPTTRRHGQDGRSIRAT